MKLFPSTTFIQLLCGKDVCRFSGEGSFSSYINDSGKFDEFSCTSVQFTLHELSWYLDVCVCWFFFFDGIFKYWISDHWMLLFNLIDMKTQFIHSAIFFFSSMHPPDSYSCIVGLSAITMWVSLNTEYTHWHFRMRYRVQQSFLYELGYKSIEFSNLIKKIKMLIV